MATDSDFAGGFNDAVFINAIKQTMKMGIPEDEEQRLVFHWAEVNTVTPSSPAGAPYEWDQVPLADEPTPGVPASSLQVDYAIEASPGSSTNTLLGTFENPKSVVTLLGEDYLSVASADYCTIGTSVYEILYTMPTIGLFGVSVYQIVIQARDEA